MLKKTMLVLLVLVVLATAASCAGPQASESEGVRLAVIAPLSGPLASGPGRQAQEGINLAAKIINEAGGIDGQELVVDWLDDRGDASEASVLAQKVADDDRYPAVIAHFSSDSCFAAMPIYEKAGIAMLTAWASHAELTTRASISFRMSPSTLFYGRLNGELLADLLEAERVAIILANAEYHKDHTRHLKDQLAESGVSVVSEELYMIGDSDFRSQLTNIIQAAPDAIAVVGYPRETGLIINQSRDLGWEGKLTVAPAGQAPEVFEIAAANMYETYMGGGGPSFRAALAGDAVDNQAITDYIAAYRAEYDKDPNGGWDAQSYDLVRILAQVIGEVGPDRAKILDELKGISDFQGVNGTMFGPDRAMVPEYGMSKANPETGLWEAVPTQ